MINYVTTSTTYSFPLYFRIIDVKLFRHLFFTQIIIAMLCGSRVNKCPKPNLKNETILGTLVRCQNEKPSYGYALHRSSLSFAITSACVRVPDRRETDVSTVTPTDNLPFFPLSLSLFLQHVSFPANVFVSDAWDALKFP